MTRIPQRHRPGVLEEERAFLAAYDPGRYPRVAVTVDIAVLTLRDSQLSVLMVERRQPPFEGHWALPGGFVREGEDLDAAARRELAEETRFGRIALAAELEQLRAYSAPDRDPRMWVVSTAFVCLAPALPEPRAGGDAARARFWPVERLAASDGPWIAFDHNVIVGDAVEWARRRLETHPIATQFASQPFTIAELRAVYEAVWGIPLDPANFRRKVLSIPHFLSRSGARATPPGGGRPAELFAAGPAVHLDPPIRRPASGASHFS